MAAALPKVSASVTLMHGTVKAAFDVRINEGQLTMKIFTTSAATLELLEAIATFTVLNVPCTAVAATINGVGPLVGCRWPVLVAEPTDESFSRDETGMKSTAPRPRAACPDIQLISGACKQLQQRLQGWRNGYCMLRLVLELWLWSAAGGC
eukprot:gene8086-8280_t